MNIAAVFPGQGSQAVGMLSALAALEPEIETTFAEASEALGENLWAMAQSGPEALLNQTQITQPALLTAGVAVYRAWRARGGAAPQIMAGHSLGEYTAYVCAGAMTLTDAVRLVHLRGQLMQRAVPEGVGAMAAVLNADEATVSALCTEVAGDEIVAPANFNSPGQIVISGHKSAVERALAALKAAGVKRAIVLPVSVPSHCALMQSIQPEFAAALAAVPFALPEIPVLANVNAQPQRTLDAIRATLLAQLAEPVRWVDSVRALNVTRTAEFGPGKVLTGLIKRIDDTLDARALGEPDAMNAALTDWSAP
jgi:[acyl-carrier-protein] S-malonyltransferase